MNMAQNEHASLLLGGVPSTSPDPGAPCRPGTHGSVEVVVPMGQVADRVVTLSDLRGLVNILTMLVQRTQVA